MHGRISSAHAERTASWRALAALCVLGLAVTLSCGCSAYRKCGFDGCPGDAQISSEVRALFGQHADLAPPNLIYVQSVDRVVYLTGQVNTDMERQIAASLAGQVSGVRRVVNSIALTYDGR